MCVMWSCDWCLRQQWIHYLAICYVLWGYGASEGASDLARREETEWLGWGCRGADGDWALDGVRRAFNDG